MSKPPVPTSSPSRWPIRPPGRLNITAMTTSNVSQNYMAETYIIIEPKEGTLVRINTIRDYLLMDQLGLSLQINVEGHFIDGTWIDVTKAETGTLYSTQSGTTDVVSVNADGVVEARGAGKDVVLIKNRGQSTSIPVEVQLINRRPYCHSPGNKIARVGELLQFDVKAEDANQDPLVLRARLRDNVSIATLGAAFEDHRDGTGTFRWTPTAGQGGQTYTIYFEAQEATPPGLADEENAVITVEE